MAYSVYTHCIIALLFLLHLCASVIAESSHGSSDCSLFTINSSSSAAASYFTHYRFYDFRNISDPQSSPTGPSSGLSSYHTTNDSSWLLDWNLLNRVRGAANRLSIPVEYVPRNVFVSSASESSVAFSTCLTLATSRSEKDSQSAAEMVFLPSSDIAYVSLRVLARVSGSPGGVAGIFTYNSDVSEADIEVLTRDPDSRIEYTDQPTTNPDTGAQITGATANVTVPGSWQDWSVHRLDWLPEQTARWVNGSRKWTSTVNVQNGTAVSQVILNMWGNGGPWSGEMAVGGRAMMEVQWIELAFNVSGEHPGQGGTVCDIDMVSGSSGLAAVSGCASLGGAVLVLIAALWDVL